jgi:hypothetical protein
VRPVVDEEEEEMEEMESAGVPGLA